MRVVILFLRSVLIVIAGVSGLAACGGGGGGAASATSGGSDVNDTTTAEGMSVGNSVSVVDAK